MRWTRTKRPIAQELFQSRSLRSNCLPGDVQTRMQSTVDVIRYGSGPIQIFGDYDVDGICAAAIFKLNRPNATVHLPNRFAGGYGLNMEMANLMAGKKEPVVLLDCGSSNLEEIRAIRSHGVAVSVIDHHPSPHLQEVCKLASVLNPTSDGILNGPCTSGLTYEIFPSFSGIHLAAMATLADQCDMWFAANRWIVSQAKEEPVSNIGLLALMKACNVGSFDEQSVNYKLAPCINAAGRMGDPSLAFNLLIEQDPAKAMLMATQLIGINMERKKIKEAMFQHAMGCKRMSHSIVIAQKRYHVGVVGIVASMLLDEFQKPVVVMGEHDGVFVGSCRSTNGIDVGKALQECSHLLIRHGGHAGAAGLKLDPSNLAAFKIAFNEAIMRQSGQGAFNDTKEFDMNVNLFDLTLEEVKRVKELVGPFGRNNEDPVYEVVVWQAPGTQVRHSQDGAHTFLTVTDGTGVMDLKCFRHSSIPNGVLRARVTTSVDTWTPRGGQSKKSVELTLVDYDLVP